MILQGDVFSVLPTIPKRSIDCVVTSPPYWRLRSYLPKGHALKPLELGSEPTPQAYVENMVRVFGLVRECLADHGTVWLNCGDTYGKHVAELHGQTDINRQRKFSGMQPGSLGLIPWRLALALAGDGWLVRSVVVWHKPAPMPASVSGWAWRRCRVRDPQFAAKRYAGKGPDEDLQSPAERMKTNTATMREAGGTHNNGAAGVSSVGWLDCPGCPKCTPNGGYVLRRGSWRPTSSWEPVLMLAKGPGYFADGEAVKQPPAWATVSRDRYTRILDDPDEQYAVAHDHETICDGANLRDVWTIASEPLKEKHYAAFPSELVYRCLRAGTSARGYCVGCGGPWVRVLGETRHGAPIARNLREPVDTNGGNQANGSMPAYSCVETIGWRPSCTCNLPDTRPGRVLDPFSGSGRTLLAAQRLGLEGVGVELNPEYVEMGKRLLYEAAPLFGV